MFFPSGIAWRSPIRQDGDRIPYLFGIQVLGPPEGVGEDLDRCSRFGGLIRRLIAVGGLELISEILGGAERVVQNV